MQRAGITIVVAVALATLGAGCGGGAADATELSDDAGGSGRAAPDAGGASGGGVGGDTGGSAGSDAGPDRRDTFTPQQEEFVVKEVAATEDFVFIPNSDENSSTVARIDGRDLSVVPVEVALEPVAVRAADVADVGSVAYVLSEGKSAISIIRAEKISKRTDADQQVSLHTVPEEINSLAISPDGRHAIGYIDADKPLPEGSNVTSLQVASLVRLGDEMADDQSFQLSVSRFIQDIAFTEDGSQAFIIGEEGVNRLALDQIDSDGFVPPLDLQLSSSDFPPEDREVEVGPDGELLVVRSSQFNGIALYRPPALDAAPTESGEFVRLSLPEPPTDIDLHVPDSGSPEVIASLPQTSQIALIETDAAFEDGQDATELIGISGAEPGLSQITPDRQEVFLYSTHGTAPNLGLLDLENRTTRSYQLRNQIRSLAVAPNSESSVIVHEKQEGAPASDASALEFFRHNHGLTIFDIESGYTRPVTLQADPASVLMTQTPDENTPLLYAMLQSSNPSRRGVLRVDLSSFRSDTFDLPRPPKQIGLVAGRLFVSQRSEQGRITFFDLETNERQTVSGYELNAGID